MVAVSPYAPPQPPPGPIIDATFRDLVRAQAAQIGPRPDPRYAPIPMPKVEVITAEAQQQQQNHQLRLLQSTMMELRVGMEVSSIFERDVDGLEMGEVERFVIPFLRAEHNAILAFIESMNIMLLSRARSAIDREESAAKEAWLLEWWEDWEQRHLRSYGGSLKRALGYDMLIHSMLAVYEAPDPGNARSGVRCRRVDPKQVFPIFNGDMGLDRVYCIYDDDYPNVLGHFGDGPRGSVTRKIRQLAKGSHSDVDLNARHEVVEYYDATNAVVTWRGEVIKKWQHNLQRPPWVIIPCCWRQPSGTALTTGVLAPNGMPGGMRDSDGNLLGGTSIQRDIARMYEPFLGPRVPVNDALEMMTSRLFTGIRDAKDPAWYRTRSQAASGQLQQIEVKNWSGGVTEDVEGSKMEVLPTTPVAENMTPMLEILKTVLQASIPAPVLQGQTFGAQSSGQAIDILNEMGYDMWVPFVKIFQMGVAECGHVGLSIQRDWGESLPGVDGIGTGFPAPRRTPGPYGTYTPFVLNRKMLEDAGCYVECRMTKFSLSGMVGALNSVTQMSTLGVGDDQLYIELLGLPGLPQDLIRRRRLQNMENSPDYGKAVMINDLGMLLKAAALRGDQETFAYFEPLYKRIIQIQTTQDMQMGLMAESMMQSQMDRQVDAQMEAGQPGLEQGVQQAGGYNPTVALQPGDLGNSVGDAGGRPAAPPPPGV